MACATRPPRASVNSDVVASITGHETMEMAEKYMEKKRKAQMAIGTLDEATAAQNSNQSVKPV